MKKRSGLNVFGNIKDGGAIFHMNGTDSMIEMQKAVLYQIADHLNISRSWEIDIWIHNKAREIHEKIIADIKSKGVSDNILELINSVNKKTASRVAQSITISHEEFANFTYNCGDHGFKKESKFFEYIPDHLKTTEAEKKAFFDSKGKLENHDAIKFFKKITNTLKERKNVCAHIFTNEEKWHCFYFTYKDIAGNRLQGKNHWRYGDHLHYISYLWGRPKEEVWAELSEKSYTLTGEHIKYVETDDN